MYEVNEFTVEEIEVAIYEGYSVSLFDIFPNQEKE